MKKRTWAEINLDALVHNFKEIRRITSPEAKVLAVVKANAYGHGAVEVTKTLIENGADFFAVACINEAKQLRRADINYPILILGTSLDSDCEDLINYDITPTVYSYDFAKKLSDTAVSLNKKVKIHIKIDSGMSRIGYVADTDNEAICSEILKISALPNIETEGIFSHFSTSDEADTSYTELQFERFTSICDTLENKGLFIPVKHIANSGAIIMHPKTHLNMVRAGIILYGLYPSDEVDKTKISLKPVMSVKAKISMVKQLAENRGVSYGKTYITDQKTKVATVPIGYADGYTRVLSGIAKMAVNNEPVPVIGRICMDQCMINVTNVNTINTGDEVIVFGADVVTADDLAQWIGSINYEIVCMVSMRIPRIYLKDGKAVKTKDYLSIL